MNKPKCLMVFDNLLVAAFDEQGNQIPELQVSLISLLCEHAEKHDWDLSGVEIRSHRFMITPYKNEEGAWRGEYT